MDLKSYQEKHSVIQDKDLKIAKKEMEKIIDGKSSDKRADHAWNTLDELEVSKFSTKNVGNTIMDIMKAESEALEFVEGIGESAVFNPLDNKLFVYVDGVEFVIKMSISDDKNTNKTKAIEAARIVLQNCN